MTVLGAIPIQIPVHRIRVRVKCLAIGGPVHAAALRLADLWGDSPEEIAEVLGLPIARVQQLLHDLEQGGVERRLNPAREMGLVPFVAGMMLVDLAGFARS